MPNTLLLLAHAAAEHGGEHHVEPMAFGFMTPSMFVALSMAVLIGIAIYLKVPGMLTSGLDAGIAEIRKQLDEAKALRAEAEALRKEYADKIANAEKDAAAIGRDTDALAKANFLDDMNQSFRESSKEISDQIAVLGMGREAAAAFTKEQELLNEAAQKHIALTPQEITAIHAQAQAYGAETESLAKLNEAQQRNQFINDELESSLEDVLFNSKSLTSSLLDMAKAFSKAALEAALLPAQAEQGQRHRQAGSQGEPPGVAEPVADQEADLADQDEWQPIL